MPFWFRRKERRQGAKRSDPSRRSAPRRLMVALEPRILFDGSGLAAAFDLGSSPTPSPSDHAWDDSSQGSHFHAEADDAPHREKVSETVSQSGRTALAGAFSMAAAAPPVVTAGTTVAYTENAPKVALCTSITVTDADSALLTSATISITSGFESGKDRLHFSDALGITGSWNSGSGVLTLTGAKTLSEYTQALKSVSYGNDSDDPAPGNRTITWVVSDGALNSSPVTSTVIVTPVNDRPVATNLGAAEQLTEDDPPLTLTPIVITDPDSDVSVTLTLSNPAAGSLGTATSGSVTSVYDSLAGKWTASGKVDDVNSLLAGLRFTLSPHFDKNFTIAAVVSDGIAAPVTGTKVFTVIPVNDPPVATNLDAGESFTEDDTVLDIAKIVVSDVDSPNITASLTLSDPAAGVLTTGTSGSVTSSFNSVTGLWLAQGPISDVNNLLAAVAFRPAANYDRNFTIATMINDGADLATGLKWITVIPVNDAPTAENINWPERFTEDAPPFLLKPILVGDVDMGSVVSVTLSLSNPAAGTLSTDTVNGVASSYDPFTGVWTASGPPADISRLLGTLWFTPAANYDRDFSIGVLVSDSIAEPISGAKYVTVTAVNDPPAATNLAAPESFVEDAPEVDLTDIVIVDVDNPTVTASLTLSDPKAGSLTTGSSNTVTSRYDPVTGIWMANGPIADVNRLLADVRLLPAPDYDRNFTITSFVSDGLAPPLTGIKNITVTAVNDQPTATNIGLAETWTEDDPGFRITPIVITDVDTGAVSTATLALSDPAAGRLTTGASGSVTSSYNASTGIWRAQGPVANVNALLASIYFVPSRDYDLSFTIAATVSDGIAPPVTGMKTMNVIAVNDPPLATNLSTGERFTEDDPAFGITPMVITDVDTGAVITLSLTLSDPKAGTFSTGVQGSAASTFDPLAGVWTANGAVADMNALLAATRFTPARDYDRNFTIAVSVDDGFAPPLNGLKQVVVTPVNDAPTLTGLDTAEAFIEDAESMDLADIVVTDPDTGDVLTVVLTLSDPAAGSLSTANVNGVASIHDAAAGVWSASGPVTDVNSLLAAVQFLPAVDYDRNFTIAVTVTDGTAPALQGVKTVTVTPVNDPPRAVNLDAPERFTEDDPSLDPHDIVITDVDTGEIVSISMALSDPAAGAFSTGTAGGAASAFDAGSGVWSTTGPVGDVNVLLGALQFLPAADYDRNFTISVTVTDHKSPAIHGTKAVQVVAVNDPPLATGMNAGEAYVEDADSVDLTDIVITDVDTGAMITATLSLSDPAAGMLTTASLRGVTSSYDLAGGIWRANGPVDAVNALLAAATYIPAPDYDKDFTIAVSIDDGIAAPLSGIKAVQGTAVNDAPVLHRTDTSFTVIMINDRDSAGDAVADLLPHSMVTDADGQAARAVAITMVDNSNGEWQYSLGDGSWLPFTQERGEAVSLEGSARLLDEGHRVRFVPNPDFYGNSSIMFRAWDKSAGAAGETADIPEVGGTSAFSEHAARASVKVNISPLAASDTALTGQDAPVVVPVLLNDRDGNSDPLFVSSFTQPSFGLVTDNGDGTLLYTPRFNYIGTDRFTYTVSDGFGGHDTAFVTLTVRETIGSPTNISNVEIAGMPTATVRESLRSVALEPFSGGLLGSEASLTGRDEWRIEPPREELDFRNEGEFMRAFVWGHERWLSETFASGKTGEIVRASAVLDTDHEAFRLAVEIAASQLDAINIHTVEGEKPLPSEKSMNEPSPRRQIGPVHDDAEEPAMNPAIPSVPTDDADTAPEESGNWEEDIREEPGG